MSDAINFNGISKVVIISPYSQKEILSSTFGGTKLIRLQIDYLTKENKSVNIISLKEVPSLFSYFWNKLGSKKIKQKFSSKKARTYSRWILNGMFLIFLNFLSRFSFLYKKRLNKSIRKINPDLVIFNYPFMFNCIKKIKKTRYALFEHNVEYFFFKQNIKKLIMGKFISFWVKSIELKALKKADFVYMLTDEDLNLINRDSNNMFSDKMIRWIPVKLSKFSDIQKESMKNEITRKDMIFKGQIDGKYVIGFVGADFEPNVFSVYNILTLAKSLEHSKVIFVIFGSICNQFIKSENLPGNVIFKGFVEDLEKYLSVCHAFINLKTTSDTGIEMKMFDYFKYGKKVYCTEFGARGFQNYEEVICKPMAEIKKTICEEISNV